MREPGSDSPSTSGKPESPLLPLLVQCLLAQMGTLRPWRDSDISLYLAGRSRAGMRPGSSWPVRLARSPQEQALGLCVNISPVAVPGLWFELSPAGPRWPEGMVHQESGPEQGKGPRTQALLLPCPPEIKACDITEGTKLLSRTATVVLVMPAGCQTLCSDCEDAWPFPECCRLLSVQLLSSTSGDTGPARAGQGDTSPHSLSLSGFASQRCPASSGLPTWQRSLRGFQGCGLCLFAKCP